MNVNRFLAEFDRLYRRMDKYDGDDMTVVIPADLDHGEKKLVLITHDETCFDSNDSKRSIWLEGENHALRPKGSGRSIMISQFLCQCHGQMEVIVTEAMSAEFPELKGLEGMKYESLRTIKPGKMLTATGQMKISLSKRKLSRYCLKSFIQIASLSLRSITLRTTTNGP